MTNWEHPVGWQGLKIWIGLMLLLGGVGQAQTIVISEFMADNTLFLDGDGDSEDWIELQNTGGVALDLGGFHLTDDLSDPTAWRFPTLSLPPGQRLLVFASNKNRRDPVEPLHTNFRISKAGGELAVTRPDGSVLDTITYPPQYEDISYGPGGYFSEPTPGEANSALLSGVPPSIVDVTDRPGMVPAGPSIIVTAVVEQTSAPLQSITCYTRQMFGPESAIPMSAIGAGRYVCLVPTAGMAPGEMVRWRIEARDVQGNMREAPDYQADPLDRDRYFGTVIEDPSLASSQLPVLHWFVENPAAANTVSGTRGSLYYLDRFYDNVNADIHGQSSRNFPKKSYDFDFNKGNRFKWSEDGKKVNDVDLLTNWADKTKTRNTIAWETFAKIGSPHHFAFVVRVQQNGAFFSTADMVEDADENLLKRNDLDPDGALYKMYNYLDSSTSGVEKKTRQHEDASDLQAFIEGIDTNNPNRVSFAYDNIDIPMTVNTLAGQVLTSAHDQGHKNYYLYRDSEDTGEWGLIAWDIDLSFGHRFWRANGYYFNDSMYNIFGVELGKTNNLKRIFFEIPEFRQMLDRRLRTITDTWMKPPGTPSSELYFENRALEILQQVDPLGVVSDADLDFQKWGSWGSVAPNETMRDAVNRMISDHFGPRRTFMYNNLGLPNAQAANAAMAFGAIDVSPASGNQREEYIELVNPNNIAVDLSGWSVTGAVQATIAPGTVLPSANTGRNKLYLAKDSNTFRARTNGPRGGQHLFVQEKYSGQLSTRGETLWLIRPDGSVADTLTWGNSASAVMNQLRITELHYHPLPPTPSELALDPGLDANEFEYVELQNTGNSTINLDGISFSEGIRYTFPATSLPPGGYVVLAKNPSAFAQRHPAAPGILLGPYDGYLSNDGERIQILDASGESIQDFTYNDVWHPDTDGFGKALNIIDPLGHLDLWEAAESWFACGILKGTPGSSCGPLSIISPTTQTADEGTSYTHQITVADPVQPARPLLYELINPPAGLTINNDGLLSWTLGEQDGPGTFSFDVWITDDAQPPRSDQKTFTLSVREVNRPPDFPELGILSAAEEVAFSFNLNASDPDEPLNVLTYGLINPPSGMSISQTGQILWTPTEGQGPSTYTFEAEVIDNGIPPRARRRALSIQVFEENRPPQFTAPVPATVEEGREFNLRLEASDSDLPANNLSYALTGHPAGMSITDQGDIRWVPTEAQGPGSYTLTITVTDDGTPPLSVSHPFTISVTENNRAPQLQAIPVQSAVEFGQFGIQLNASDADQPLQALTFSLGPNAPAGAQVTSDTGWLSWIPDEGHGGSRVSFDVLVSDGIATAAQRLQIDVAEDNLSPTLYIGAGTSCDTTLIPAGSTWRFTADFPGVNWQSPAFPEPSWSSGPAKLGRGEGDEATVISLGTHPLTTWFRHRFTAESPNAYSALTLRLKRDDGAVVYLNGKEVHRDNLPAGQVGPNTPAVMSIFGQAEDQFNEVTLSPADLVNGENVIAVELHQVAAGDASFDLALEASRAGPCTETPLPQQVLQVGTPWSLALKAFDGDQPLQTLSFHLLGTPPNGFTLDTTTGLAQWTPLAGANGRFTVSFEVRDSAGGSAESSITLLLAGPVTLDGKKLALDGSLQFEAEPGVTYEIERCDSLIGGSWTLMNRVTATNNLVTVIDPDASSKMERYYRVRIAP